jgi:hypothetical protein
MKLHVMRIDHAMRTQPMRRHLCSLAKLFVGGVGLVATLAVAWGADRPVWPDPSKTPVPVVEGAAAAQAELDKALASGKALIADLTIDDGKYVPPRCPMVRAKTAEVLPPGRYRLHALVATTPQDNIISEAVTVFLWVRGRYKEYEPKEYFPEPGKLSPLHFDITLDKPEQFEVCFDWKVGESVSKTCPGGKGEQIAAYHKKRQAAINQLGVKDAPDMSMNEPAPADAGLDGVLDDMTKDKLLAPRALNAANLPANRMLLAGVVIERMSPVEVVAVRTDPVAFEPGATGRATADVRNLDAKPATAKLVWTVTEAKRPDEILARHEETVTLAAGEQPITFLKTRWNCG